MIDDVGNWIFRPAVTVSRRLLDLETQQFHFADVRAKAMVSTYVLNNVSWADPGVKQSGLDGERKPVTGVWGSVEQSPLKPSLLAFYCPKKGEYLAPTA